MKSNEFAALFRKTKDEFLTEYAKSSGTSVSQRITALDLNPHQKAEMMKILDDALTDTFYTILMGLGGAVSIGGIQQGYTITDENGDIICNADDGELEASAWLAFQSDRNEEGA